MTLQSSIVFGLLATWIIDAIVLMVVDRLNIGLKVRSFLYALVAAAAIAVVAVLVAWMLVALGVAGAQVGLFGFIIAILLNALVLWAAAKFSPGFDIANYPAAIVVAIVMAAIGWLVAWVGEAFI